MENSGLFGEVLITAVKAESHTIAQRKPSLVPSPSSANLKPTQILKPIREELSDAFLTNETNIDTAVTKAEFYDKLFHGMSVGLDEDTSRKNAIQQAGRTTLLQKANEDRGKTKLQLRAAASIELYKDRITAQSSRRAEKTVEKSVEVEAEEVVEVGTKQGTVITTATNVLNSINVLQKLVQKLNRASTMNDGPVTCIPDFEDEPLEFRKIRQNHYRITMLMSEFDQIAEAVINEREKEVSQTHEKSLKYKLSDQRKKLIEEYKKKISHEKCISQITTLTDECTYLRKEHEKDIQQGYNVISEMVELKHFKTSAGQEHKILLEELAKRRIKNKRLTKQIKKLKMQLDYKNGHITECLEEDNSIRKLRNTVNKNYDSDANQSGNNTVNEIKSTPKRKSRPQSGHSVVSFQEDTSNGKSHKERIRPQSGISAVSFQDTASSTVDSEKKSEDQMTLRSADSSAKKQSQSISSNVSFHEQDTEYHTETAKTDNGSSEKLTAKKEVENNSNSESSNEVEDTTADEDESYSRRPEWNKSTATNLLSRNAPSSALWERNFFEDSVISDRPTSSVKKNSKKERHDLYEKLAKERSRNRTNNYKSLGNIVEECVGILTETSSESTKEKLSNFLIQKLASIPTMDPCLIPQQLITTDYASSSDGDPIVSAQRAKKRPAFTHPGISEKESKICPYDFSRIIDAKLMKKSTTPIPISANSQKPREIKNVSSWIAKIVKSRPLSAPKPTLPPITNTILQSPIPLKTKNDTIISKRPVSKSGRDHSAPKALPNGTVRRIRPKSAPAAHKFGINALLSSTEGSIRVVDGYREYKGK